MPSGLMFPEAARPMPPVIGGGEVGEDVAEEVVGDDHVEARRVGRQEDRGRVDVQVVDGRRRGTPHPTSATSRDHTAPACTSTLVLWTRVSLRRGRRDARAKASRTTRSTPYAVLSETSVATSCGRADADGAAVAGVGTLGALADDDEVDVAGVGAAARPRPGRSGRAAG